MHFALVGGPYGAQPMGLGSERMPQVRYGKVCRILHFKSKFINCTRYINDFHSPVGIGGLIFGGPPMGYNSNPYGKFGEAQYMKYYMNIVYLIKDLNHEIILTSLANITA